MFRHPKYLEIPWEVHWHHDDTKRHHYVWWLMGLVILAAIFLIGVGVTGGVK